MKIIYIKFCKSTHPSIIKPKPKERKLKVEILMDLGSGGVDVPLVVSDALVAALVVEPVHKVASDLGQPCIGNDVRLSIVLVARVREDSTIDVSCKITRSYEILIITSLVRGLKEILRILTESVMTTMIMILDNKN